MAVVVETLQSLSGLVGREIATTEWFSITQEHIQRFAEVIDAFDSLYEGSNSDPKWCSHGD